MEHVKSMCYTGMPLYLLFPREIHHEPSTHASSLEILISCGKQRQEYCPPRRWDEHEFPKPIEGKRFRKTWSSTPSYGVKKEWDFILFIFYCIIKFIYLWSFEGFNSLSHVSSAWKLIHKNE